MQMPCPRCNNPVSLGEAPHCGICGRDLELNNGKLAELATSAPPPQRGYRHALEKEPCSGCGQPVAPTGMTKHLAGNTTCSAARAYQKAHQEALKK